MLPHGPVSSSRRRRRKPASPTEPIQPTAPPESTEAELVDTEKDDAVRTYWIWMWVAACGVVAAAYILGLL